MMSRAPNVVAGGPHVTVLIGTHGQERPAGQSLGCATREFHQRYLQVTHVDLSLPCRILKTEAQPAGF